MKKFQVLFVGISLILSTAVAQSTPDTTKFSLSRSEIEKIVTKAIAERGKDTSLVVGKLFLLNGGNIKVRKMVKSPSMEGSAGQVKDSSNRSKGNGVFKPKKAIWFEKEISTKIDEIIIIIQNGVITSLQVIIEGRSFTNGQAPIEISARRFLQGDRFYAYTPGAEDGQRDYIILPEFLGFKEYSNFFPDDTSLVLTRSEQSKDLIQATGINSILDIRAYSDLLGTISDKPNGLVSGEARFKQFLHRRNVNNQGIYFWQYLKAGADFTKFDSRQAFVNYVSFNRSSALQRSWISGSLSFNIFNTWISNKSPSRFYIDLGGRVNGYNLKTDEDSIAGFKKDSINLYAYGFFTEIGYDLVRSKNSGANVALQWYRQFSPDNLHPKMKGWQNFFQPRIEIYWHPMGSPANKIFARMIYTIERKDQTNSFLQVQVGYSVQLSKLVGSR